MPRKAVSGKRKCRKAKKRCKLKRRMSLLYGFDGQSWRPVLVNPQGNLIVTPTSGTPSRVFHEETYTNISAQNDWYSLPPQETSLQTTYSYAVINRSPHNAAVRIEISPDGVHYATDREETVLSGETKALVPTRFLKYTRLSVRAMSPGETVLIDVFYQAQSIA